MLLLSILWLVPGDWHITQPRYHNSLSGIIAMIEVEIRVLWILIERICTVPCYCRILNVPVNPYVIEKPMVHLHQVFMNLCGYSVNKTCLEIAVTGTSVLLGCHLSLVWVLMCACVCVHRPEVKVITCVFYATPLFLRQFLSLNVNITKLARSSGQGDPRIFLWLFFSKVVW